MRKTKNALRIVLSLCVGISVGACEPSIPTYRYRLTVEVDTPAGLRSGSSVIEVHTSDQGKGFPGPEAGGIRHGFRGEAVVVDLGKNTLFVPLVSSSRDSGWASIVMFLVTPASLPPAGSDPFRRRFDEMLKYRGKIDLLQSDPLEMNKSLRSIYPLMVYFKNINDPSSVEEFDRNNFSEVFGNGYRLKKITVQITDEPVTFGKVRNHLRWIDTFGRGYFDPKQSNVNGKISGSLGVGYFIVGENK